MSEPPRPEPGTEYAAAPTVEFTEARSLSAAQSLAAFLGVTPGRALSLLQDPAGYCAEIRSRQSPAAALRQLERRCADPSMFAG